MVFRVRLLSLLILLALLAACGSSDQSPDPTATEPPSPRLRIRHNGGNAVDRLVIIFPEERVEFTDIEPGETTAYQPVTKGVYRYAAYEAEIDGQFYEQPVIDWVGEEPVEGKDFTWLIDVEVSRGPWEVIQLVQATIDR